jgi:hypothetical protein
MFSITIPSTGIPKQIAVAGSNTAGTVLYTVPTGRKFIGSFAPQTANCYIVINGIVLVLSQLGTSGSVTAAIPVTLVTGTVITTFGTTSACGLFGVESDA